MLFAQFLPSALSKVATRSLLCYERLLSTRVSNVARVHLERALDRWRSFRPSVAVVSGCRFRLNFGRMEFGNSYFCNSLFFATVEWIHVWRQLHTSCLVSPWVSLTVALSVSRMYHQGAFSVDEASVKEAVAARCALFPSCLFHPCSWLREGICSLVHIGFCVKTLHLGTVSFCLAWSPPMSPCCCCVDCLHCDLDILYFTISYVKLETEDRRDLK